MKLSRRLANQCRNTLARFPAARELVVRAPLWRWQRRAVARGAALGVACALLVPIGQIPVSAIGAAVIRANVPVAVTGTFVTNPLTTLPIYYGAHNLGQWILGTSDNAVMRLAWGEMLQSGSAIVVGAIALAIVGATATYALVNAVWIAFLYKRKAQLNALALLRRSS